MKTKGLTERIANWLGNDGNLEACPDWSLAVMILVLSGTILVLLAGVGWGFWMLYDILAAGLSE